MKKLFRPLILWVLCEFVSASPSSPLRHIVSEFGTDVFFVMGESRDGKLATGHCYKISDEGRISPLWETTGFYAWPSQLRLTPDGQTLVRLHTIPTTLKTGNPALISVYSQGRLAYSLTLDIFMSWQDLKPNPFTGDNFVILDAEVRSPFEIVGTFEFEVLTGSEKKMTDQVDFYLKISTADGKTSLVDLSSGKVVHRIVE